MKKIKITEEQYKKIFINLSESEVKGGINRVNKMFKKEFAESKEEKLNIKKPIVGIPNSSMKTRKENPPPSLNEDIISNEVYEGIKEVLTNVYMNPSQKGLTSTFFLKYGITWGDIISYLTSMGVVGLAFCLIGVLMFVDTPNDQQQLVIFALGFITSAAGQVLSFYFGSSQGSKDKTEDMKGMVKK
jgi:hypothetical protein